MLGGGGMRQCFKSMFYTIQSRVSKSCINFGNSVWNLVILFPGKSLNLLQLDVSFKAKCTEFNFACGSVPDATGRTYSTPDLLAGFKGSTSKGG